MRLAIVRARNEESDKPAIIAQLSSGEREMKRTVSLLVGVGILAIVGVGGVDVIVIRDTVIVVVEVTKVA